MKYLVPEVAHWMGLIPVIWLAGIRSHDRAHWWIGAAFAVSWIADSAAHWVDPMMLSIVYPISQSALIGAVLMTRSEAWLFLAVLLIFGMLTLWFNGVGHPELLLRSVAWGIVTYTAYQRPQLGLLGTSLILYFGFGLIAWGVYVLSPGWWTWGAYQWIRAMGVSLFCLSATYINPRLRIV